jgi:hypothetical protein|tara:strand:+ start:302 stop:535 length:234 start_codon:yes stop_codon:yes gene_type:complete
MEIKNKQFTDLLDRSDYIKSCGRMSLNIDEGGYYLSILYDYINNVFVEFDMDLGNKEVPTNKQLEITKEFFNQLANQ